MIPGILAIELTSPFMAAFIQYLLPVIFAGLATVLAWLLSKLGQKLSAQAKDTTFGAAAGKITHFMQIVVQDLEATLKPGILEAVADGKVTSDELKTLRTKAIERVKLLLGTQGLEEMRDALGLPHGQIDPYLGALVETTLSNVTPQPNPN